MSRLRDQLLESLQLALQTSLGQVDPTDLAGQGARAGRCVACGAPVEAHFGRRNRWVGCSERGRRSHG